MFQKWSGRVQGNWKNKGSSGNIRDADEVEGDEDNSGIYEDVNELKQRLLPTLTATFEQVCNGIHIKQSYLSSAFLAYCFSLCSSSHFDRKLSLTLFLKVN